MGEIISLFQLGYPHVICCSCKGNRFHIKVREDDNGTYFFEWLVCTECGSEIALNLQPVYPPESNK